MGPRTDSTARIAALALLGLPETATGPQIVDAYRRLARATHPDATGRTGPGAATQFAAIHDAYRLLVEQPAHDDVEPERREPRGGPHETERPPQASSMRPGAFRSRPPIVAGPVTVTPSPEQRRPHPRRPR